MSGFCSQNTERITDANYTDLYSAGKSSLPNGGAGWAVGVVDSRSGLVPTSLVDAHIAMLLSQSFPTIDNSGKSVQSTIEAPSLTETSTNHPQTNINPASAFSKNAAMLRTNIESEYCFYYKRYIYILTDILQIAATTNSTVLASDPGYQQKKIKTEALNAKLNQILQILQSLVNSRLTSLNKYYGTNSGVNQVNIELDHNRNDLIRHTNLLKNSEMENQVRAAMIDYTIEKNSSSRNLLAIYGFLNIVAVGMIFYLYRSTK